MIFFPIIFIIFVRWTLRNANFSNFFKKNSVFRFTLIFEKFDNFDDFLDKFFSIFLKILSPAQPNLFLTSFFLSFNAYFAGPKKKKRRKSAFLTFLAFSNIGIKRKMRVNRIPRIKKWRFFEFLQFFCIKKTCFNADFNEFLNFDDFVDFSIF